MKVSVCFPNIKSNEEELLLRAESFLGELGFNFYKENKNNSRYWVFDLDEEEKDSGRENISFAFVFESGDNINNFLEYEEEFPEKSIDEIREYMKDVLRIPPPDEKNKTKKYDLESLSKEIDEGFRGSYENDDTDSDDEEDDEEMETMEMDRAIILNLFSEMHKKQMAKMELFKQLKKIRKKKTDDSIISNLTLIVQHLLEFIDEPDIEKEVLKKI